MKNYLKFSLSFFLFLFLFFLSSINAQVTNISGTINIYSQVVSTSGPCSNTLTVASALGFAVDDTVLIIQMKGATIDTTNSVSFGTILNYNDAGNYEFGIISAIVANTITLQSPLMRSYTPSGLVQLVRVPSYVDANITGILTCQAWNGTTGGVLAFIASGTVTMNADIDVSGRGFRGGPAPSGIFICAQLDYYYNDASGRGGRKGEGIAEYITNKNDGRGSQANGGGGGNSNDSGGGGGGNSTDGGRGGDQVLYSPCAQLPIGGEPGRSMTYNTSLFKIFMGGGGGSGQQNDNDNVGVSGMNGGAIVFIKANSFTGNNQVVRTNGDNNTQLVTTDGAGGAGAGGTIILDVQNFSTQVNLEAKGGNGGNSSSPLYCLGMGGGGSGGTVLTPQSTLPANVVVNLSGGNAGQNAASNPGCPNSNWGAAAGQTGGTVFNWVNTITPLNVDAGPDTTICDGSPVQLNATGANTYSWFPTTDLSNPNIANPVATPTVTTTYYVVGYNASCSDTDSVTITISPAIIANAGQDQTICSNGSVQLNATGGTSYSWTPSTGLSNPNIPNPVASPSSTTQYIVQVSDGICFGFDTVIVTVSTSPVVTITGTPDICAGDSSLLTASGASSYTWSTSQTSSAISVTPSVPTTYTVTGTDAIGCTATSTFTVNVNALPTIVAPQNPALCMGDTITLIMSGALSYHWSPQIGILSSESFDSTTVTVLINSSTTYTVTGSSAEGCSATVSFVVTVFPLPPAVITPPGPVSVCNNNPATLSANAGPGYSYQWFLNGNPIPSAVNAQYTTTILGFYSVQVTDSNGCSSTSTETEVISGGGPDVIIVSSATAGCSPNTIFIGYGSQSITLTAVSANAVSFLWSTGATTSSISVTTSGSYSVTAYDASGCASQQTPQSQITISVVDIRCGHGLKKIILCHVPEGNPGNPQTICVAPSAIPHHLAHHEYDCLGPCSLYYPRMGPVMSDEIKAMLYPNPFSNVFNLSIISSDDAPVGVTIYDLTGRMVETYSYVSEKIIMGNNLTEGIYFVDVIQGTQHQVVRLIKTK